MVWYTGDTIQTYIHASTRHPRMRPMLFRLWALGRNSIGRQIRWRGIYYSSYLKAQGRRHTTSSITWSRAQIPKWKTYTSCRQYMSKTLHSDDHDIHCIRYILCSGLYPSSSRPNTIHKSIFMTRASGRRLKHDCRILRQYKPTSNTTKATKMQKHKTWLQWQSGLLDLWNLLITTAASLIPLAVSTPTSFDHTHTLKSPINYLKILCNQAQMPDAEICSKTPPTISQISTKSK